MDKPEDLSEEMRYAQIPERVVLGAEQNDQPVALRVERAGNNVHAMIDNLLDLVRGQGQVLAQRIVSASVLEEFQEVVSHCCSGRIFTDEKGRDDIIGHVVGNRRMNRA